MRVWLDDVRPMPHEFDVWVKTADAAIHLVGAGVVTFLSFDHDLGQDKTGYDVAKFIETYSFLRSVKRIDWEIHSGNPVGAANIDAAMKKADGYWTKLEEEGYDYGERT